jgi:hypothetical protein
VGAKLKYNYYDNRIWYATPLCYNYSYIYDDPIDIYNAFFILYKNKLYHYKCYIYKNNEIKIKLDSIFFIINNGYKYIDHNYKKNPNIRIIKSIKTPNPIYFLNEDIPKIFAHHYKIYNLIKKIIVGNNIMYYKRYDYDSLYCFTNLLIVFNYDYKKNIIIITKDKKSVYHNVNYVGLFRNLLLFI